ncbi:recombinase family protein [Streptomyces qaidamensis]|uniref:recombinase family protein n=1 Tax=Streptomyces qaidamensis TaxID=1783515 RepID=UPI0036683510
MAAVQRGEVDVIIVYMLWRNRRERAEGIEILRKHEVSVLCVKGPELDLTTAAGRLLAGLLGEVDTFEAEQMPEREQREMRQRVDECETPASAVSARALSRAPEHIAPCRWAGAVCPGRSWTRGCRSSGKARSAARGRRPGELRLTCGSSPAPSAPSAPSTTLLPWSVRHDDHHPLRHGRCRTSTTPSATTTNPPTPARPSPSPSSTGKRPTSQRTDRSTFCHL